MSEEIFLFWILIWRQIVSDTGDKFLLEEDFKRGNFDTLIQYISFESLFWDFDKTWQLHNSTKLYKIQHVPLKRSIFQARYLKCFVFTAKLYFIYSKSFLNIFCIKKTNFPCKNYSFWARVNHKRKSSKNIFMSNCSNLSYRCNHYFLKLHNIEKIFSRKNCKKSV